MFGGVGPNVVDRPIPWRAGSADSPGMSGDGRKRINLALDGHDARLSTGYFKTMPVYGAESRTPNHTQFRNNKTAGKRLALFQK